MLDNPSVRLVISINIGSHVNTINQSIYHVLHMVGTKKITQGMLIDLDIRDRLSL